MLIVRETSLSNAKITPHLMTFKTAIFMNVITKVHWQKGQKYGTDFEDFGRNNLRAV